MAIGRTEDRNPPGNPLGRRPRCDVWGSDPRNPSGPAVNTAAHQGRTHDRNRPDPSQLLKSLCEPGAVHTRVSDAGPGASNRPGTGGRRRKASDEEPGGTGE